MTEQQLLHPYDKNTITSQNNIFLYQIQSKI